MICFKSTPPKLVYSAAPGASLSVENTYLVTIGAFTGESYITTADVRVVESASTFRFLEYRPRYKECNWSS